MGLQKRGGGERFQFNSGNTDKLMYNVEKEREREGCKGEKKEGREKRGS